MRRSRVVARVSKAHKALKVVGHLGLGGNGAGKTLLALDVPEAVEGILEHEAVIGERLVERVHRLDDVGDRT